MEENTSLEMIKKDLSRGQYIVIYFFLYAFIGWLLETGYAFYVHGHFVNRGFMYGPFCPLYGWGAVILVLLFSNYRKRPLKLFVLSAIVFSIFEYIAGFGLEALFKARWWDYTNDFLNLNGRISIMFSFVWGIISILFLNQIHPFIERNTKKMVNKIPYLITPIVLKVLLIYFITDTLISSIHYIKI